MWEVKKNAEGLFYVKNKKTGIIYGQHKTIIKCEDDICVYVYKSNAQEKANFLNIKPK